MESMQNNKLIKLLSQFSKAEISDFKQFIHSPYFNKNQKLIDLFAYISTFHPDFEQPNFTRENTFFKIFPDETYDFPRLTKLLSKLFKLAEQFLIHNYIKKENNEGDLLLLDYYQNNNLSPFFLSALNKVEKRYQKIPFQNEKWLFDRYRIEFRKTEFLSSQPDERKGDINFQVTSNTLDTYFLSAKLKKFCFMLNRARTVPCEYKFNFLPEIENFIATATDVHFYVKLWHTALKLLRSPEDKAHYQELKAILFQFKAELMPEDIKTIYTYLENTAKFVFTPGKEYYEELFHLYQMQLNEKIIYYDGFILPSTLKNVVTVELNLKKLDWVEELLNSHEHKIYPTYQEEERVFHLCKAMLFFEKKAFDEALESLNQTKFQNIYLKISERNLRLKLYFELEIFSLFEDTINSYRKFLSENRQHIATFFIEANRNFINIIFAIYNAGRYDSKRLLEIEKKVTTMDKIPERNWLLEKIESLKK